MQHCKAFLLQQQLARMALELEDCCQRGDTFPCLERRETDFFLHTERRCV